MLTRSLTYTMYMNWIFHAITKRSRIDREAHFYISDGFRSSFKQEKVKFLVLTAENFGKRYRGRLEIVKDVLSVVDEADVSGSKKTHIMYGASLSHKLITQYLKDVSEAGLIKYDGRTSYYVITEKGKMFLKLYEDYKERSKEIERMIVGQKIRKERLEGMLMPCQN